MELKEKSTLPSNSRFSWIECSQKPPLSPSFTHTHSNDTEINTIYCNLFLQPWERDFVPSFLRSYSSLFNLSYHFDLELESSSKISFLIDAFLLKTIKGESEATACICIYSHFTGIILDCILTEINVLILYFHMRRRIIFSWFWAEWFVVSVHGDRGRFICLAKLVNCKLFMVINGVIKSFVRSGIMCFYLNYLTGFLPDCCFLVCLL